MGEQVANNREQQMVMTLREDKEGILRIVTEPKSSPGLIRPIYTPIGNRFLYPKKWGRKPAADIFIQYLIEQQEQILIDTRTHLDKLNLIKKEIQEW
jgi:hypothetical protein